MNRLKRSVTTEEEKEEQLGESVHPIKKKKRVEDETDIGSLSGVPVEAKAYSKRGSLNDKYVNEGLRHASMYDEDHALLPYDVAPFVIKERVLVDYIGDVEDIAILSHVLIKMEMECLKAWSY